MIEHRKVRHGPDQAFYYYHYYYYYYYCMNWIHWLDCNKNIWASFDIVLNVLQKDWTLTPCLSNSNLAKSTHMCYNQIILFKMLATFFNKQYFCHDFLIFLVSGYLYKILFFLKKVTLNLNLCWMKTHTNRGINFMFLCIIYINIHVFEWVLIYVIGFVLIGKLNCIVTE